MGKVIEKVRLTSFTDPGRSVELDALVDTGATMVVLPQDVVDELGLRKVRETTVRYGNGETEARSVYGVATVEIQGRVGDFDVLAEKKGTRPLIGQSVLEQLDFLVDAKNGSVVPNPASPDMPVVDVLTAAGGRVSKLSLDPGPLPRYEFTT